jgi:hypothetical protein
MPKQPTVVLFTCQNCGRTSKVNARTAVHLLPWKRRLPIEPNGVCRYCHGDRWTISVVFVESDVDVGKSLLGLLFGHVVIHSSVASSRTDYPDIPADVVAVIDEQPRTRLARVMQLVRNIEREWLKAHGGRECPTCGILFVPRSGVPWAERGYCSYVCQVQAEGVPATSRPTGLADDKPVLEPMLEPAPVRTNSIPVECVSGHRFEVQMSFSGLMRPCPVCGQKTRIP